MTVLSPAQTFADGIVSRSPDYSGASARCVLDDFFPGLPVEIGPAPFVGGPRHIFAELFSGLDYSTAGHCHPKAHALLCHIEGEKDVVLYPPNDTALLYPHPVYAEEFATSRVDFFSPDRARFPRLAKAHRLVAHLEPGDALFIPVGTWHAVNAPGVTTSVSYFSRARAIEQRSVRSCVRNHVGWAIGRTVEQMAPSLARLPRTARAFVSHHHPTALGALAK